MSDEVMGILEDYSWPGNVRELENLIERAVVLAKSRMITRESLPAFLTPSQKNASPLFTADNEDLNLKKQIQEYQKKAILNALRKSKGVQKKAADLLGVKPTTLNEMIKRLNIDITNTH